MEEATIAQEAQWDPFATKARYVLVFDPEKVDRQQMLEVVRQVLELKTIDGFRGCLPCAASGIDPLPYKSGVLTALKGPG